MPTTKIKKRIDDIPSRVQSKLLYDRFRPQYEMAQAKISRQIRKLLNDEGLNATFKIRVKTFDSYFNKVLKQFNESRDPIVIRDLIGIRIITSFIGDLDLIKRILVDNFNVLEIEEKGENREAYEFGYDSIHLLICLPKGIVKEEIPYAEPCCEIQLRTKLQDAWAEVEHELIYKADDSLLNKALKRKLASLNASLTLSDIIFQEIRDYQRERQELDERRRQTLQAKIDAIEGIQDTVGIEGQAQEVDDSPLPDISNGSLDKLLHEALDAHSQHNYSKALRYYSFILNNKPGMQVCSIISNHRGMVYFVQSRYERAIEDFTRAIQTNPNNFRAYNNRGHAYRMLKMYDRALEDFDHSIEIDATQPDAYLGRAQVCFEMNDYVQAERNCSKALNIEPHFEPAQRFMQLVRSKLP
ncbi:tetratricopeptide repeat protein [candidate division KSB1 bacterium]|nr:tetratricopeptide repeat protein [candidate division KSB1 bacterium]RQW11443.1 MAG: tetratricopeptide repeat protein [candidate division KSB1 bacterium]